MLGVLKAWLFDVLMKHNPATTPTPTPTSKHHDHGDHDDDDQDYDNRHEGYC